MKKTGPNQIDRFLEECRKIDFSVESMNREKNLQILKAKELYWRKEDIPVRKKKRRKPAFIMIAALISLLCLSMVVYGKELLEIVKTLTVGERAQLGEHVQFIHMGNNTDADNTQITEVGTTRNVAPRGFLYNELEAGISHFHGEAMTPSVLPSGYAFEAVSFYSEPLFEKSKYMQLYYTDGAGRLTIFLRFMDETTGYTVAAHGIVQEIIINGRTAVMTRSDLSIQIGDVLYSFMPSPRMDLETLVRIVESLE